MGLAVASAFCLDSCVPLPTPEPAAKPIRRWAEWLHQALAGPRGTARSRGQAQHARLAYAGIVYPVFRDEEEIPADAHFTENIQRALENSDLFIILCSPRACQSRFVGDEIRY